MAFGIKNNLLAKLLINYVAYLEKKGKDFGPQDMPISLKPIVAKKEELIALTKEVQALDEDFTVTLQLLKRMSDEVEKSKMPANALKNYMNLLNEKSKRVDERKEKIRKILDAI